MVAAPDPARQAERVDLPPLAPALTDGVVRLRPPHADDLADVVRQCRDPLMQRWTRVPMPYEPEHAREWLDARRELWEQGRELTLAIETGGRFCGSIDLRPDGDGAAALGYGLAPWGRGAGLLHRALMLMLPWGFDALDLDAVHWTAMVGNWPSRRAAWHVGVQVEGNPRAWAPQRGVHRDAWVGTLLRDDPLEPAHPWLEPVRIEGPVARLRAHRPDDAPRMAEACTDPLTRHWLGRLPAPYTEDDARDHLEQLAGDAASGRSLAWAVAAADDDRLVGEVALFGLGEHGRSAEIGYWLHPGERGRGVMTAAVAMAARHALLPHDVGGLGRPRLVLRAADGNVPSQRVAERAGFRRAGVDRQAELLGDGSIDDLVRYDLLPGELPAGELPAGELPAGELPAGELPAGDVP